MSTPDRLVGPFPAATIPASKAGSVIDRKVSFNYDRRYDPEWFTLLDAYNISRPSDVEPGFDPDRVVVIFCDADGGGPEQGMELNPISDILVELSSAEWKNVRHFPCGPYLSRDDWTPPKRVDLRRIDRDVAPASQQPTAVLTEYGTQFALF